MYVFGVILVRILQHQTEFGGIRSISRYSVQMEENTDQNISEYRYFSRSENVRIFHNYEKIKT